MSKSGNSFDLFLDFLEVHIDEYHDGLYSLPDDFNLSDFPEIEASIYTLSERLKKRTGKTYHTGFLADTLHAFRLTYPDEGVPIPPMDS